MKSKIIGLLLLVVVLPIALLSWVGYQLAQQIATQQQEQIQNLLKDQLAEVDFRLEKYFKAQETVLQQNAGQAFETLTALRDVVNSTGIIENIFIINADDTLAFPNPISPLNQRERDFYSRIKVIIDGGDIQNLVRQTGGGGTNPSTQNTTNLFAKPLIPNINLEYEGRSSKNNQSRLQKLQSLIPYSNNIDPSKNQDASQSQSAKVAAPQYDFSAGWFTWYWGRGLNLIYWQRLTTGNIICVALDRSRWISDLIGELPDSIGYDLATAEEAEQRSSSRSRSARIINANGETVYQWGSDLDDESLVLAVEIPTSIPINAWKLQLWVPPTELQKPGIAGINVWLGILASAIALVSIAWIFVREYTKELQEASRRVSFVNQVSHELRTPLTNIRMYAELLSQEISEVPGVESSKARQRLGVVESESERLSRLIANVLTFASSQKKTLKVRPLPGVVDDCIQSVTARFAPNLEKLDLKLEMELQAPQRVLFDSDAIEQVLENLLGNIEKYAAEGQLVHISSIQQEGLTVIRIRDGGRGIKSAHSEKIFEPFWRESNEVQKSSGTGIGLSISRELCRLHGGDLTLDYTTSKTDRRQGACFRITLKTEGSN